VDAGLSGKSIEGRPAMLELLEDAKQGRFQCVVSWKLNRIARNLSNLLFILDLFTKHNINYVSITEQFESSTPLGNFVLQMMGATAQLEREQISQNTRIGMQERSKQGKWNSGNNVLGYEWVKSNENSEPIVRIIPEEAVRVRNIFE
jgi:site-specific DNA recombinase